MSSISSKGYSKSKEYSVIYDNFKGVDFSENGYTATFDNGTLTLSAISSGATVESLKEKLSKDYKRAFRWGV